MREPITKLAIVPLHAIDRTIVDCLAPTIKQLSLAASGNESPVIFFIARAVKKSRHHFDVKRVVLVTLGYLLLYDEKGAQTRAILVADIQRVIVCQDSFVVFKIPREHDLVLKLEESVYLEYFINILIVLKAHQAAKTPASVTPPTAGSSASKKRRDDVPKLGAAATEDEQLDVQASSNKYDQLPGINKVNLVRNGAVKYAENVPIPMILSVDAARQDFVEAILHLAPPPPPASESGEGQLLVRSAADLATAKEVLRHPLFRPPPPQLDATTTAVVPAPSGTSASGVAPSGTGDAGGAATATPPTVSVSQSASRIADATPTTLVAMFGEAQSGTSSNAAGSAAGGIEGGAGRTTLLLSSEAPSAAPAEAAEARNLRNTPPPAVKIRAVTPLAAGRGLSSPDSDSGDERSTPHGPADVFARHPAVQQQQSLPSPPPSVLLASPSNPTSTPTGPQVSSVEALQQLVRSPLFFPPAASVVTAPATRGSNPAESDHPFVHARGFGGATGGQTFRSRLTAFYQQHDPSRLDTVDELVIEFIGREQQCFDILYRKYGTPGYSATPPPPPQSRPTRLGDGVGTDGQYRGAGVTSRKDPHAVGCAPPYPTVQRTPHTTEVPMKSSADGLDASHAQRVLDLEAEHRKLSDRAHARGAEPTSSLLHSIQPSHTIVLAGHHSASTSFGMSSTNPVTTSYGAAGQQARHSLHGDTMDTFEASIAHHDAQTRVLLRQHRIDSLRSKVHQAIGQRASSDTRANTDARSLIEVGLLQEEILALMAVQQADQDEWDRRRTSSAQVAAQAETPVAATSHANEDTRRARGPAESAPTAALPPVDVEYARWYYSEYLPRMMFHHSQSQRQAPPANASGDSNAKTPHHNGTNAAPVFPVYAGSVYSVHDPREQRPR